MHLLSLPLIQEKTFIAYLLSGGSPIACTELAQSHTLPEYVIELTRDWIDREVARSGRTRFLEVKRGGCNPFEFTWFAKQFPGKKLIVLCRFK